MNINRNNYEEYFLLYADSELSLSEKQMVDEFVRENIDLEEELLILRQAVVKPDKNISLKDKSFLLKHADEFISNDNYEAIFVLLNDNELSESQVKETEDFIKQNGLEKEFALLQRTKSSADTSIVFPDKSLLYKKEKDGRVVPLIWWRAMAAAVIAGFGLWLGINYLQNNNVKPDVAVTKIKTEQPLKTITKPVVTDSQIKTSVAQKIEPKNIQTRPSLKNIPDKTVQNKSSTKDVQVVKNITPVNKHIEKKPNEKNIEKDQNEIVFEPTNTNEAPIKKVLNNPENLVTKTAAQDNTMNATPPNLYAKTASLTQEKNENYVFYNVTTEEFNRSKIGGFLKKLKRNIARRSPFNNNNEQEVTQQ